MILIYEHSPEGGEGQHEQYLSISRQRSAQARYAGFPLTYAAAVLAIARNRLTVSTTRPTQ
jgi:hypothetical protein